MSYSAEKADKKAKQLGMNPSTAQGRLIKDLLWDFIVKAGKDSCCKCGGKMERGTFSIEHVTPWLDSENPLGLFFDLQNISYSHLSCNVRDARKVKSTSICGDPVHYRKGCRCKACVEGNSEYRKGLYTPEKRHQTYKRSGW